MHVLDILKKRKLYYQSTDEDAIKKLLDSEHIPVYLGVDPTGDSLHLGHLIPLMVLGHLSMHGHTPIVLIGGGTSRVGDPSGKTETRPILSEEALAKNAEKIKTQIQKFTGAINIEPIFVNNAQWFTTIPYIDFIRDIGRHFSVSRMLSFDTYKRRLDSGLSFLEFNYQLLQAYDYLQLYEQYNCKLQIGGADQWANIVAGCDLIRRIHRSEVHGYTIPLLTRSDGSKMGKTESGAIFIDEELTAPYELYQYMRNTSDDDVLTFLTQYTFLDLERIAEFENCKHEQLNPAKELLAYTLTEYIHGTQIAQKCVDASKSAFYGIGSKENIPSITISQTKLPHPLVDLLVSAKLVHTKSEARRLIEQGGARMNDDKITAIIDLEHAHFTDNEVILSAGKKRHIRIVLEE